MTNQIICHIETALLLLLIIFARVVTLPHVKFHRLLLLGGIDCWCANCREYLRRLRHEGWLLQATVLLMKLVIGSLVIDYAEFACLPCSSIADIDAELCLQNVMVPFLGTALVVDVWGNDDVAAHATVTTADVATEVEALMMARDVAGPAFAAWSVGECVANHARQLIKIVFLITFWLDAIIDIHRVQYHLIICSSAICTLVTTPVCG